MSFLISPERLIDELADDNLFLFDATFVLPTMQRDAAAEFEQTHIPNAQFFDINAVAAPDTDLPHMVPNAADFQEMMRDFGLCQHHKVVIYDNSPFLSAARAWWLLRLFGKDDVFVLDGGLPAYVTAGGKTTHGPAQAKPTGDFTSGKSASQLMLFDDLRKAVENKEGWQILDARPAPRFAGTVPEPRAGLRSGHMPGAMNVSVTDLLNPVTGQMRPLDEIRSLFDNAGLDFDKPAVTSCGSGVTAAGLTLALAELGKFDIALYDGSWAEWGASDAPIESDS